MNKIMNSAAAIWAILVSLTVFSVALFEAKSLGPLSVLVIVFIAAAKSRLVILYYMEAKNAPGHWRQLYEAWNFAIAALIVIGYYTALFRGSAVAG